MLICFSQSFVCLTDDHITHLSKLLYIDVKLFIAGVISGAILYIRDEFEVVDQSSFLQVHNSTNLLYTRLHKNWIILHDPSVVLIFCLGDYAIYQGNKRIIHLFSNHLPAYLYVDSMYDRKPIFIKT